MTKKAKAKKAKRGKKTGTPRRTPSTSATDVTDGISLEVENENEQETGANAPKKCPHLKTAVRITRLSRQLPSTLAKGAYCMTCRREQQRAANQQKNKAVVNSAEDAQTSSAPATPLHADATALWLCLKCGEVNCGRNDNAHAVAHYDREQHDIAIHTQTLECWCYACDTEVNGTSTHNLLVIESKKMVETILKPKQTIKDIVGKEPSAASGKKKRKAIISAPGLTNLGNTCFFNSVMQCINSTKLLQVQLQAAISESRLVKGPFTGALVRFLASMNAQFASGGGTVNPRDLFGALSNTWRIYRMYGQQDSHELLRRLLDGVREEQLQKGEDNKPLPGQRTFVDRVFGGKLCQLIVCDACKNVSYSFEEYMDLSLPILQDGIKQSKGFFSAFSRRRVKSPAPASSEDIATDVLNSIIDKVVAGISDLSLQNMASRSPYAKDPTRLQLIDTLLRPLSTEREGEPVEKPVTLRRCLVEFMAVETLDGDSAYSCDHCYKLKYGVSPGDAKDKDEADPKTESESSGRRSSHLDTDEARQSLGNESSSLSEETSDTSKDTLPAEGPATASSMTLPIVHGTSASHTPSQSAPVKAEPHEFPLQETDGSGLLEAEPVNPLKERSLSSVGTMTSSRGPDTRLPSTNSSIATLNQIALEEEDVDDIGSDEDTAEGRSSDGSPVSDQEADGLNLSVLDNFGNTMRPDGDRSSDISQTPEPIAVVEYPSTKPARPPVRSRAYKRYLLHSVPDVLVMHLKRFQQVGFGGRTRKVEDPVAFEEYLDLSPFMAPDEVEEAVQGSDTQPMGRRDGGRYRLNGVVVHGGGLFSGHYIAYVRIGTSTNTLDSIAVKDEANTVDLDEEAVEWVYCSDTHVRPSSWEEVARCQAYILFYERVQEIVGR
ncbi:uncharacterized protein SPPG_00296 [Spizellomyces punctatus DAOM BR117]|uniref:Ubiquitin carboxyl-terminal hydrolase n=1 Tax=Spizellomyces punctatus (strain DAOM BR117) TaxID=645134 RepID=A0A0L0HUM3_SPIPD|nr:uncharacterized protein SPPG_00296 [Spizellomyces punctatus DAOM BR117]KND04575.1 hypothetical protein SPPG_00296 [Spizellomyces punctatus DAOM BR117]|eukprot:XP_016612614.1 hypothetical protein SPPG_00296 [Spizellomyces punctatus DAOM BR117]